MIRIINGEENGFIVRLFVDLSLMSAKCLGAVESILRLKVIDE
jgi:hypothetical protein